ncbi:MAG: GHKL domain-containing protein [Peptococcaceae bacterium]|nr:GHKL domain-containing protein [Peptococcaceae bacterium]
MQNRKSVIVTILLLAFILTGAFLSYGIAIAVPIHNAIEQNTNVHARMLFVDSPDLTWEPEEIEILKQNSLVQLVLTQDEWNCGYHVKTADGKEVGLSLMGSVDSMRPANILHGKGAGLEDFELLIPSHIVMDDGTVCDGKDFLGQRFTLELDSPVFKSREDAEKLNPAEESWHVRYFTVAGVYDVAKVAYMGNRCFTTTDTVRQLHEISRGNYNELVPESGPMDRAVVVLTESHQAAQLLELQLNAEGYDADIAYYIDSVHQMKLIFISAIFFVLLTGLSFCILFQFVKHRLLSGTAMLTANMEKIVIKSMAKQCSLIFLSAVLLAIAGYGFVYPVVCTEFMEAPYLPVFSDYFALGVAGVLILNLIVLLLFLRSIQSSWLKARVQYHDRLLKEQQSYHKNLAVYHQRVRQLHHDMNNHFLILYHALKQQDISAALQYAEKQLNLLAENKMLYTGYLLMDTVLDYKKQFAVLQQTEYVVRLQMDANLLLSETFQHNFAIMLASCIDNGLEAVKQIEDAGKRWIRITLKNDNQYLYCKVENSVKENIVIPEGQLPLTTKDDMFSHGLGLLHVKQLAEEHQGCLTLSCEEKVFTAAFMMRLNNNE